MPFDAELFETYRPLMFSIAYRMLGSATEAEDIVQETYLRYHSVPLETITSPRALLSTIATRLCLNQLQSARAKRETYIGPWLPEPILTEPESDPYQMLIGGGRSCRPTLEAATLSPDFNWIIRPAEPGLSRLLRY